VHCFVCACLAFAAAELHAAHPHITEDIGTQGKGRWQLDTGWRTGQCGAIWRW
jgi:hypothetical protein